MVNLLIRLNRSPEMFPHNETMFLDSPGPAPIHCILSWSFVPQGRKPDPNITFIVYLAISLPMGLSLADLFAVEQSTLSRAKMLISPPTMRKIQPTVLTALDLGSGDSDIMAKFPPIRADLSVTNFVIRSHFHGFIITLITVLRYRANHPDPLTVQPVAC